MSSRWIGFSWIVALAVGAGSLAGADQNVPARSDNAWKTIDQKIGNWPAHSKAVAYMMIHKYGMPAEVSTAKISWNNNGPWKRTVVMRQEVRHDFPMPQMEVVKQTVDFQVPADRMDELATYNGSVMADRTAGELTVRGGSEEMNFLVLNQAVEVARGREPAQARENLARDVVALGTAETPPASASKFTFEPGEKGGDPDRITLKGAPRPAEGDEINDASIIGMLAETNKAEIKLGNFMAMHGQSSDVKNFARMLKNDHAKAQARLMKLGPKAGIQPVWNERVMDLMKKDDQALAQVAMQEGSTMDRTFVDVVAKVHQERLTLIDKELAERAVQQGVKQELTAHRNMLAHHLGEAKRLQAKQKTSRR